MQRGVVNNMARSTLILLGSLVPILALLAFGPKPDRTLRLKSPQLPDDLDTWIRAREANETDLRAGDQRRIDWADPVRRHRTPLAIVYLHGFTASPQEISPVPEQVAQTLRANLYFARMPGHGHRNPEALRTPTLSDWINEGIEALAIGEALGERVIVIGTSTGGTLGLWLAAAGKTAKPDALIMVSPNFKPRRRFAALLLWPWFARVVPRIVGEWLSWKPVNEAHSAHWNIRYPVAATVPMMQLVVLARELSLNDYAVPTLILRSSRDGIVDPAATDAIYARMPADSTRFQRIDAGEVGDPCQHVLAGRILSPDNTVQTTQQIVDFLSRTGFHSASD